MPDHLIRNARLPDGRTADLLLDGGRIAAVGPGLQADAPVTDAARRLLSFGLVETHIHLDKSRLLAADEADPARVSARLLFGCGCGAHSVASAIAATAQAKRHVTEQDVYDRAEATLRRAIAHGVQRIRTHVETDPPAGLLAVRALQRLARDYAWAVDLQLCAFPQDGLTHDAAADAALVAAMDAGCPVIGGAPYADRDPQGQLARVFELARAYDADIDLHLDNDLEPTPLAALAVARLTERHGWGGRVAVGHVTKLSTYEPAALAAAARTLGDAGVAVTVLPATDLFMMARGRTHDVPRGVAPAHALRAQGVVVSLATNNVLNPFTPYGDNSLLRMANLYANLAQLGAPADLEACFGMVTADADRILRRPRTVEVGAEADLVLFDAGDPAAAVAEIAVPLCAWKGGRLSLERPAPRLLSPGPAASP